MPELKAVVIGHSFVRRLGSDIAGKREGYPSPKMAARTMNLSKNFKAVHFYGNDAYTLHQLRDSILRAGRDVRPDVCVINCASNDLCQRTCDVQEVVTGLISYARFLRSIHHVKFVAILGVINRKRCREVTQEIFQERAHKFNGLLKIACAEENGVQYVNMRGFWRDEAGNELPVSSWSTDGIHPARSQSKRRMGIEKYRHIVRRSLLDGSAFVKRQC